MGLYNHPLQEREKTLQMHCLEDGPKPYLDGSSLNVCHHSTSHCCHFEPPILTACQRSHNGSNGPCYVHQHLQLVKHLRYKVQKVSQPIRTQFSNLYDRLQCKMYETRILVGLKPKLPKAFIQMFISGFIDIKSFQMTILNGKNKQNFNCTTNSQCGGTIPPLCKSPH